jgi:NADPH:quinone reductase-like Zn-dependent oxidoreductase
MPTITFNFEEKDKSPVTVEISKGEMILDVALDSDVNLHHNCGAVCACSTCHIYVEQGADALAEISDKEEDFVEVIQETWGGTENILDNMGASYLSKNVEVLKRNGHLAIIGMQGGTKVDFQIDQLLRKNATISATSLRGRPESEKSAICREVEKIVWPWITDGTVKLVVDRVMPIEQAGEAQKILEAGEATGKIILQVR